MGIQVDGRIVYMGWVDGRIDGWVVECVDG
jgi:hypothetical protein